MRFYSQGDEYAYGTAGTTTAYSVCTLKADKDDMYNIELAAKGDESNPNYLPIPERDAYIILRMYGPSQAIQDGKYPFPTIEVVQ